MYSYKLELVYKVLLNSIIPHINSFIQIGYNAVETGRYNECKSHTSLNFLSLTAIEYVNIAMKLGMNNIT
jgi:hypothetical protein